MWSGSVVILLLAVLQARITYGQIENKFFRKDYVYIADTQNFYKINTLLKTWSEAKVKCVLEGATLFYPEDEDEVTAVTALWNVTQPQINKLFIGVAAWNVEDIYETVDGRQLSDVYNNWAYGEPDNAGGDEGCVVLQKDGTLKDEKCSNNYAFVCKKTLGTLDWNVQCNIPDSHYRYNNRLQRCYKFHLTPKNWTDAYSVCHAEQSYLAILNSPLENEYLINLTAEAPKDGIGGNYLRGAVHLGFHNKNGLWETIQGCCLRHYMMPGALVCFWVMPGALVFFWVMPSAQELQCTATEEVQCIEGSLQPGEGARMSGEAVLGINVGVPLHESGFGGWGYTQPDGGEAEKCGSMFYTGQLNDIGCWQRMFFICEHEVRTADYMFKYGNDIPNVIPRN